MGLLDSKMHQHESRLTLNEALESFCTMSECKIRSLGEKDILELVWGFAWDFGAAFMAAGGSADNI